MDNELETLKRAREYIFSMAKGLDPLTGFTIEDESLLNNPRIIRCLFYVANILDQVIDNGGKVAEAEKIFFTLRDIDILPKSEPAEEHKPRKRSARVRPFFLTKEQLGNIEAESQAISISSLLNKANELIPEDMKKLQYKQVVRWLAAQNFLIAYIGQDEKTTWRPTDAGHDMGFIFGTWSGARGPYDGLKLTYDAQIYVLHHLMDIAAYEETPHVDPETGEVLEK